MLYIIPTDTCFWIACSFSDKNWYNRIYEVKWRDFKKPLAIMINEFSILESLLNKEQLDFLKNYHRPWTVLLKSDKLKLNFPLIKGDNSSIFPLKTEYVAFRVANNDIQKKLIDEVWAIYLTSANFSWEKETYNVSELKEIFWKYDDIKILAEKDLQNVSPSDIFEFIWETTEIKYLRKN